MIDFHIDVGLTTTRNTRKVVRSRRDRTYAGLKAKRVVRKSPGAAAASKVAKATAPGSKAFRENKAVLAERGKRGLTVAPKGPMKSMKGKSATFKKVAYVEPTKGNNKV